MTPSRVWALVVAAGEGRRAGPGKRKQFRAISGHPVLESTLSALARSEAFEGIVVVLAPRDHVLAMPILDGIQNVYSLAIRNVAGGANRQASVRAGLAALDPETTDYVVIHDAVRPFVSKHLLERLVMHLEPRHGVVPVVPVSDALKRVEDAPDHGHLESEGRIVASACRDHYRLAQTPQGFPLRAIQDAHRLAIDDLATSAADDDASIALKAGLPIVTIPGDIRNRKLTYPEDFSPHPVTPCSHETRVASGIDVHALVAGRKLWLGGLQIPSACGLAGHSDADVVLHALTDALLGTIADGDIGSHFPPTQPEWQDAASARFVRFACKRLRENCGTLVHVDITILAESIKISPHREEMRRRIAEICALPLGRVAVKATTTETLGFIGRKEGIACMASVTANFPVQPEAS